MHFVFSYDLAVPAGQRRNEIVEGIENILNTQRNVRRLSTFYIVHVNNINEWETLRQQFTGLSQTIPETLHFIMTPPQQGGHYNGLLATGEWNEINTIASM